MVTAMIAALFVDPKGPYANLPGVDIWDESRDTRNYAGPFPVVAHPPCARWCRLAGLIEARYGHKKGDDGGCFASALASVRTFGGIIEHPAYSDAWPAFDLTHPVSRAWTRSIDGGWTCSVNQLDFGHPAEKKTWLYAFGVTYLPTFDGTNNEQTAMVGRTWTKQRQPTARCSFLRNHDKVPSTLRRLSSKEASRTPDAFRDLLIKIAQSVKNNNENVIR